MANAMYNNFKTNTALLDWEDNTTTDISAILMASGYQPDIDNEVFYSDISASEAVGTGYSAGGKPVLTRTITLDAGNDWAEWDGADIVWTGASITARGVAIFIDTGVPATSRLIGFLDFGSDQTATVADFTVEWHLDGIFKIV